MSEELPEDLFPQFKKSGPAPWEEICELARQLPGDAGLLKEMIEQIDILVEEPWEDMDCEFIYICATLALAAPEFSREQKASILTSLRKGMEELDGCGDLSEAALRSTMASFGEPGYEEILSVQQWVEQYSTGFEAWAKEMEAGWDGFGEGADTDMFDEDEDYEDDDES